MRLAWFRPASSTAAVADADMTALVAGLARTHEVELFDEARAHDFPWMHARRPFHLCIYELGSTASHRFILPYALHVPGVVVLRRWTLPDRRLAASRFVVLHDEARASWIQDQFPGARLRVAPAGVDDLTRGAPVPPTHRADEVPNKAQTVTIGVLDPSRLGVIERAATRARAAGAAFETTLTGAPADVLRAADVVLALQWNGAPPTAALLGMAAGKAVIALEMEDTAAWPALDPQTWQPRGPLTTDRPILVSLDLRDEEHSLMLALRRLTADPALRATLGAAATAWWREHATVEQLHSSWMEIIRDAAGAPPDAGDRPPLADGTERAREVLAEMGVETDLF